MAINFQEVGFTYQAGTPFASEGLHDVNFKIPLQQFTALIGHTGSGKSTTLQLLDGLTIPTVGKVEVLNQTLQADTLIKTTNQLREHVGLVFQFPEAQLFEDTVLADVMFGPLNFGASKTEAKQRAQEALRLVDLSAEFESQSPFDLSGGQMRRVAIAGVLALEPELLILDEPTAGLDPKGQADLMALFARLQQERHLTVVVVTHQMEFVAQYAQHVVVFEQGTVVKEGTPAEIFADSAWLRERQLDVPMVRQFTDLLTQKGVALTPTLDLDQLTDQIVAKIQGGRDV
ncbi:hypothetical protein IV73_GL001000 [Weissella kandleri]|uniref:Energy-coupling factor transporter ATP-binding protein EcfA2 n=1 Tax=Weissella kandleri TaxID=1616 RepID=A0A0R2JLS0_9LACO|nr:energy-coupling factor transporter ATPase [Weissella kandleri]KRN74877.1 hypothetical protein IV73_GL001000 [Weissella kandleri]